MATQQLNFNIRIGYDDAAVGPGAQRTEAQLRGVVSEVERVAREMAAARNRTIAAADGFNRLGISLTNAAKGFAAYQAGSLALNLGQTARTLQDMEIRLQGVTSATGGYAQAEQFLIDLATRHHKTLTGLADGYTSLLGLEESGIITRKEAQRMMEGLSNAQSKYGTTTEQIKNSLYGLSQALSASTVQMDELHQVTDPMPGLLTRMEKAAGVASGGFKDMAEKGQLTRDIVKDSLIKTLDDLDGAAAKTAGTMTASVNDMQREWELLAKATEEPITLVVNVSTDAASQALKAFRQEFETAHNFWNSNDLNRYSLPDLQANLGYLQKAGPETGWLGNANAAGQKNYEYRIQQYQDAIALKQGELDKRNAAQPAANTAGFTGPTIPDDVFKQRKKDAEALQEQYQKLLEQAGNYRESLTLEAKAKGLSEEASRTYVEQGLKLIAQKDAEKASRTANRSTINAEKETRQAAIQTIDGERKAMEQRLQALRADADAEKAIELIRAGTDRTAQLEIESRYIENERVLNQQRLQSEIAYDQQLLQTTRDRSQAAELTQQLAQNQTALNAVNDDASKALERLKAAEQARGDALLQQLNTDTADKQQLGTLAQRLAMEGQTAEQIERQLAAKAQILQIERDNPNRPDITQAAIRNIDQEQTYRQVLDDTRKASEQYAELWKDAARRIDDSFQRLWMDLISGQNSVGGSLKKMMQSTMAEMAHAAITKPFEQRLLSYLGAPSEAGGQSSSFLDKILTKATSWLEGGTSTAGAAAAAGSSGVPELASSSTQIGSALTPELANAGQALSTGATALGMASNALSSSASALPATTAALPATASVFPTATAGGLGQVTGALGTSTVTPTTLTQIPEAAAGAGSSIWSLGATPKLASLVTSGLGRLGVGAATSGFIGSGFANMGWGAIGSIAGNLLGMKGTNPIANLALPTVGGIAGGALGGALGGAALGAAAGPIGAIVGALLGSALSMLFNSTPKANAIFTYKGGTGAMALSDVWKRNGGQLDAIKGLGNSLYSPLRSFERGMGVNLGQFDTRLYQRDQTLHIWGKDQSGEFFARNVKFEDAKIKEGISAFMLSIVKRESVLKQFDGALLRGAIKLSTTMEELSTNYNKAIKIRLFSGDITDTTASLMDLGRRYTKYQDNTRTFLPGTTPEEKQQQADQLNKLAVGLNNQFSQMDLSLKSKMGELTGVTNDAAGSLQKITDTFNLIKTNDSELEKFAKRMGIFYQAINPDQLEAARKAAEQTLRDSLVNNLKQAAGVADTTGEAIAALSKQFKQFAADADTLGVSIEAVGESLLGAVSNLAAQIRKPAQDMAASLTAAINEVKGIGINTAQVMSDAITEAKKITANSLKSLGNDKALTAIATAQTAILANYQAQKAAADGLANAYKQIADYSKSLIFSDNSIASPLAKKNEAKSQYDTLISSISKETDTAKKTTLLSQVTGSADTYLKSLLAYYGPTTEYASQYADVKKQLDAYGSTAASKTDYQKEAAQNLANLQGPLDLIKSNADQQVASLADVVTKLGLLNDSQTKILGAINTDGVTYNALGGITSAVNKVTESLAATAKISGLQKAIDTAITANPKGKITETDAQNILNYLGGLKDLTGADKTALKNIQGQLDSQQSAYTALGQTNPADRAGMLSTAIGNLLQEPATKSGKTVSKSPATSAQPEAANDANYNIIDIKPLLDKMDLANTALEGIGKSLSNTGSIAANITNLNTKLDNKSSLVTGMGTLNAALSDKGTLSLQLGILNAQFDGKAPLQTTLTGIQTALGDKSTLAVKLTNLNTKLSEKGELAARLDTLTAQFDGKAPLQTTLTGIQTALSEDSPLANKLTNVNAKLTGLNKKTDDAQTTREAIKTGIEALPPLLTAISTGNQTAAATLAGGLTGFGKALTDGLSSLGSAIYSGMNQVGNAVGAKITDLNTALKTTQNQLATANSALAQAQTALIQAQTAKTPVAVTAPAKSVSIGTAPTLTPTAITAPAKTVTLGTPPTLPARASGGPAQGWTLVGEQGPELVRFPVPVQVYSNDQSRSLLKESGNQDQTEIIASLRRLIELQAATIATLQQQGRNQSEQLDGLHREFARFSGKARLAA